MDGFSALRACVAQLSEVVDAVERISDTCVMRPEEAALLSQRLGCALAPVVMAGSMAAEAIVDKATLTRSQRLEHLLRAADARGAGAMLP